MPDCAKCGLLCLQEVRLDGSSQGYADVPELSSRKMSYTFYSPFDVRPLDSDMPS